MYTHVCVHARVHPTQPGHPVRFGRLPCRRFAALPFVTEINITSTECEDSFHQEPVCYYTLCDS